MTYQTEVLTKPIRICTGDAVMTSLWSRVQDADGRMDEQEHYN